MARFKPLRQKPKAQDHRAALPCVVLLLLGFLLVGMLFFALLKTGR